MTIPPWLRAIQQTYWSHFVIAAAIVAGGSAFTCFGTSSDFSIACIKGGVIAGGIYLFGSLQHGPDSASFKADGTVNKQVMQDAAKQATADAKSGK